MKTILVAEDDSFSRELVCEILQGQGYRIVEAMDGREALKKIEENHPDLVLMDIRMPFINGLDAIQKIRHDGRFASLRVLALTAYAMAGDEERILSSGFNGYVSKPIDAEALEKRVRELLG
jgi:CheY-like chemotaxis protein